MYAVAVPGHIHGTARPLLPSSTQLAGRQIYTENPCRFILLLFVHLFIHFFISMFKQTALFIYLLRDEYVQANSYISTRPVSAGRSSASDPAGLRFRHVVFTAC